MQKIQKNKTEWKELELKEVAQFINGRAFKPSEWESKGKLIIRIQDLTGSITNPNYTTKSFDKKYLVKKDDLLISWSATLDAFLWDKEEGWLNQHIFKVVPKKESIYKKYLYYFVKKTIHLFLRESHGSTMKHITKGRFESIKIPIPFSNGKPDVGEQERIVKLLEEADELTNKSKKAKELLDEYLKSVFYEMFLKDKEKWKEEKLSSYIDEFIVPQRNKPKKFGGNIPWCRIEDFNGIYLSDSKSGQYVSEDTIKKMNLKVYPKNTVLVSCSAYLGKSAIVKKPLVTNQTFIGLVPSKKVIPLFLYKYMMNLSEQLNYMASGSTIKYLSKKNFQELPVNFPPLPSQEKFASIVEQVEKMKENINKTKQNSEELFNSLISKAFGGEL